MNYQNKSTQQLEHLLNSVMTDLSQMSLAFDHLRKANEALERRLASAEKQAAKEPVFRTGLADKARVRALEVCFAYRNDSLGLLQWAQEISRKIAHRRGTRSAGTVTMQAMSILERGEYGKEIRSARKSGDTVKTILQNDRLVLPYITCLEEMYLLAGCENKKGGSHEKEKLSGKTGGAVS